MPDPAQFRLGEELGRGALGRVVRVHGPGAPDYAGKILHASHQADAKALARFEGEAEILLRLRHPNVVAVHGLEEIDGEHVLVMELVDGLSLANAIALGAPFAESRIASIGKGIAAGLSEAHHAGLIHRDLKPDNVLLDQADNPKLVDFGMARATSFAGVDPGAFAIVGTPDYMAPETVDPLAVDARADLYSLGCMLYEMAVGRPPYSGATAFAILEAHRDAEIPALPEQPWSSELRGLIASLLAKSPADRPQSAAAVEDVLSQLVAGRALVSVADYSIVHAGQCAACGDPAVPGVSVCFGCGLEQVRLESGDHTVFVTGPGETTHKIDSLLRDKLLEWLRSNPSLGLDPAPLSKQVPRIPFVVVVGVSEISAATLVKSIQRLGLEAQAVAGGRFALRTMKKKAWKLGGRIALIGGTSVAFGLQHAIGTLLIPVIGVGMLGALAGGWYTAGKAVVRRTGRTVSALPSVIAAALGRVVSAAPGIRERRHRESLRAVVQRVLAARERVPSSQLDAVDVDLARVLDLALVAVTRIDDLEAELEQLDLRNPTAEARAQMLERDSWAARLLELTAFLDVLRASYVAIEAKAGHQAAEEIEELRAHIEALEEVQAL